MELGYSLAGIRSLSRLNVGDARVYVSAQNLFTATDYTGLDPESTDILDRGTYPNARSFLFGTTVKF